MSNTGQPFPGAPNGYKNKNKKEVLSHHKKVFEESLTFV